MSERYASITLCAPIHGLAGYSSDCFVAADGYIIVRSADRLDVLIHNTRTLGQRILPWSSVRYAAPEEAQQAPSAEAEPLDDDEPPTKTETPAARRSGWPKGKPRAKKGEAEVGDG